MQKLDVGRCVGRPGPTLSAAQLVPLNPTCLPVQEPGSPVQIPREGALPHKRKNLKNQKHMGTGESTAALLDVWRLDRSPHFPVVKIRVKAQILTSFPSLTLAPHSLHSSQAGLCHPTSTMPPLLRASVPSACGALGHILSAPSLSPFLVQFKCRLIRSPLPDNRT